MCGIVGIFGQRDAQELAVKALELMESRGRDGAGIATAHDIHHATVPGDLPKLGSHDLIGHRLHAIVNHTAQPIKGTGVLVANCEIYNWQELSNQFGIDADNDASLVLALIERMGFEEALSYLDGPYALAYWHDGKVMLARDILGIKPLWFSHARFAFASQRNVLSSLGYTPLELNPRKMLVYDTQTGKIDISDRPFFSSDSPFDAPEETLRSELKGLIIGAIAKRVPDQKVGLLFSGGVDSTVIARVLKHLDVPFTCYTAALLDEGMQEPHDLSAARETADLMGLTLKEHIVTSEEVTPYLQELIPLIDDSNVVKVGVALPFYLACQKARADGVRVMFSGLGSEEIFAGYERHSKANDINAECRAGLLKMYERDLYRDDVVTMHHGMELRVPLLDTALVRYALKVPASYKIHDGRVKAILRDIAKGLGVPEVAAERKKRAAQYGSNFDKAIGKLARHEGKNKASYLNAFLGRGIMRLGVLFSSGKDSTYATWIMQRQMYDIGCLISIWSKNPSSYMYHTPNIWLTELQAKGMGIPLIVQETEGEQEKELDDLRAAMVKARDEYGIEGIVTGALASRYQRDRIERLCDELSLKMFSPLWQMDQEEEMRNLIKAGFDVRMVSIAAEGLDESWLARHLTLADVTRLAGYRDSIGLNVAGEGGEFESLVLDGPVFDQRIVIDQSRIEMEDTRTGSCIITQAHLEQK